MVELYRAAPTVNSMKPLICAKKKGLEFISRYVNLLYIPQHEPWFVAINPNGQVPVLVRDSAIVRKSRAINE